MKASFSDSRLTGDYQEMRGNKGWNAESDSVFKMIISYFPRIFIPVQQSTRLPQSVLILFLVMDLSAFLAKGMQHNLKCITGK